MAGRRAARPVDIVCGAKRRKRSQEKDRLPINMQAEDIHGLWCLKCLSYVNRSMDLLEKHHIYPRASRRSLPTARVSPPLGRTIALHKECHTGKLGIQRAHDAIVPSLLEIQTFTD